jgi:hypothetical protein
VPFRPPPPFADQPPHCTPDSATDSGSRHARRERRNRTARLDVAGTLLEQRASDGAASSLASISVCAAELLAERGPYSWSMQTSLSRRKPRQQRGKALLESVPVRRQEHGGEKRERERSDGEKYSDRNCWSTGANERGGAGDRVTHYLPARLPPKKEQAQIDVTLSVLWS